MCSTCEHMYIDKHLLALMLNEFGYQTATAVVDWAIH